jgi:hypothetical protein
LPGEVIVVKGPLHSKTAIFGGFRYTYYFADALDPEFLAAQVW